MEAYNNANSTKDREIIVISILTLVHPDLQECQASS
jgi:hypothetical protein